MVELRKRVDEALEKLAVLHRVDCTKKQAREAWDWVFQTNGFLDAYDKDPEKTKALFANEALVRAGVAVTTAACAIRPASAVSGTPNLAHKFYGEVYSKK
jgi:hypothetical protein